MSMARIEFDATDETGDLQSNVSVEVRLESTNALVSVYSDRAGTVSLGNPFVVADGKVGFHVAGGAYKITLTAGSNVRTRRYVAAGLAAEIDQLALALTEVIKTSAYTIALADRDNLLLANSASAIGFAVMAASVLGDGFSVPIKNIGAGDLTITPNGAETIDGAATKVLKQNDSVMLTSNGTNLRTIFAGGSKSRNVVNAADFGLIDGTDGQPAIQAAIDYAKALTDGAKVFIPRGAYTLGAQLVFWPTVPIEGEGSWCTKLNYTPNSTLPAISFGDASWQNAGGDSTKKNWQFSGIRLETSNGANQKHGFVAVSMNSARLSDLQFTGFTAGDGFHISGNPFTLTMTKSGYLGAANSTTTFTSAEAKFGAADVGKTIILVSSPTVSQVTTVAAFVSTTEVTLSSAVTFTASDVTYYIGSGTNIIAEGHYNLLENVYVWNNSTGGYLTGIAGMGQSNSNTIIGCTIRQNINDNLVIEASNANTWVGGSLEAKSGTNHGIVVGAWATDNHFYAPRLEGSYDFGAFVFRGHPYCKRNSINMPVYGGAYPAVDPTNASFSADPGRRNYIRAADPNGNLINYGPRMFNVSFSGMGLNGTTAQRPVFTGNGNLYRGQTYYDTTLAALIYWNGASWRYAKDNTSA